MGSGHQHGSSEQHARRMAYTLGLVVAYMFVEIIGGLLANSLAILADAGHMLSDAGSLVIALIAMRIALRPASPAGGSGASSDCRKAANVVMPRFLAHPVRTRKTSAG